MHGSGVQYTLSGNGKGMNLFVFCPCGGSLCSCGCV